MSTDISFALPNNRTPTHSKQRINGNLYRTTIFPLKIKNKKINGHETEAQQVLRTSTTVNSKEQT